MKTNKKQDRLGVFLAAVVGTALFGAMLLKTFMPRLILPRPDVLTILLLSLAALVADHYLIRERRRDYRLIPVYAALVFGLFPFAACFMGGFEAMKTALLGTVVFTLATVLFDSLMDRLSSGPVAKAAPLISAVGMYLAAQCLVGIV